MKRINFKNSVIALAIGLVTVSCGGGGGGNKQQSGNASETKTEAKAETKASSGDATKANVLSVIGKTIPDKRLVTRAKFYDNYEQWYAVYEFEDGKDAFSKETGYIIFEDAEEYDTWQSKTKAKFSKCKVVKDSRKDLIFIYTNIAENAFGCKAYDCIMKSVSDWIIDLIK